MKKQDKALGLAHSMRWSVVTKSNSIIALFTHDNDAHAFCNYKNEMARWDNKEQEFRVIPL